MQKYSNVVQNRLGRAIPGASVLVTLASNGLNAALFSDNGVTPIDNPLTTDNNGHFAFYAADARYNLQVSANGTVLATESDILLEDPADGSAALSASDGSSKVGFQQSGTGAVADTVQDELRRSFFTAQFSSTAQAVVAANGQRLFVNFGEALTVNVPSQYSTVSAALAAMANWIIHGTVTIQLADGTYNPAGTINLNHLYGNNINIKGNEANPDACVFMGTNPPTFDLFMVSSGNAFGTVSGIRADLTAKADSTTPYTAFLATNGAEMTVNKCKSNNWYYGVAERDNSQIRSDSTTVTNAGDVGFWAYRGGSMQLTNCVSNTAADVTNSLGFGFQAEYGGVIDATGCSATGNQIAGAAALSGGIVRAPGMVCSSNVGSGFYASDGGQIMASGATANTNGRFGLETLDNTSRIRGNSMTLTGNTKGPIGPSRTPGSRNLLINPEFTVSQFGTTFTNPATGTYTIDRWRVRKADGSGVAPSINVIQNSGAAFGDGVTNCLELAITAVGTSGAGAFWLIEQPLANPAAFRGKTITGQFLIWSSAPITLTARAEITDSAGTSTSSNITSLNTTPRLVTVTRTVDAAASTLAFDLSLFLGAISGTASIYVASCQLKEDLYPTPVEVSVDAQSELMRCLPYAERLLIDTNEALSMASAHSTTSCRAVIHHYPKRRLPLSTEISVSNAANLALQANNTSIAMSSVGGINPGRRASTINFTASGLTQGTAGYLRASADGTYVDIRAEV